MGNGTDFTISLQEPSSADEARDQLKLLNDLINTAENSGLELDVKIKRISALKAKINEVSKKLYKFTHTKKNQQVLVYEPQKMLEDNSSRRTRTETQKICKWCQNPYYRATACPKRRNGNPHEE